MPASKKVVRTQQLMCKLKVAAGAHYERSPVAKAMCGDSTASKGL